MIEFVELFVVGIRVGRYRRRHDYGAAFYVDNDGS